VEGPDLPSFDLVVATVDRADGLRILLDSLDRQTHRRFRVLVVDQNPDDRVLPALAASAALEIVHLRASRGLSRARNTALPHLAADVVAFPDDDCAYPGDLLKRVASRLAKRPDLDGVTGRTTDGEGRSAGRWSTTPGPLSRETVWHRANSASMFLRRDLIEQVGEFDERLGLGSGSTSASGEEIDYLVRGLERGARIEFDPTLVVLHELRTFTPDSLRAVGRRDGASVGFILRKHRYPARTVGRMLVRPVGGAVVSLVHGDVGRARFQLETLRGRIAGLRAGAR
jgi:glycosyltransferase involved in cell wall biosynthesis